MNLDKLAYLIGGMAVGFLLTFLMQILYVGSGFSPNNFY